LNKKISTMSRKNRKYRKNRRFNRRKTFKVVSVKTEPSVLVRNRSPKKPETPSTDSVLDKTKTEPKVDSSTETVENKESTPRKATPPDPQQSKKRKLDDTDACPKAKKPKHESVPQSKFCLIM
jgi:hypothetical protein